MALVVEDGTGLDNADSFISLTYFKDYCAKRGKDLTDRTDTKMEEAIVRGTQFLSESFRWKGIRKRGRNHELGYQNLAWPRYGVYDKEGGYINSDELPKELFEATAEAAFYELENVNGLQPVYTAHDRVRVEKAGPVSITYDTSRKDAYGARPLLLLINDLIGEFTVEISRFSGKTIRV